MAPLSRIDDALQSVFVVQFEIDDASRRITVLKSSLAGMEGELMDARHAARCLGTSKMLF